MRGMLPEPIRMQYGIIAPPRQLREKLCFVFKVFGVLYAVLGVAALVALIR